MGSSSCSSCNIWEYTDKVGCNHCDNCFTIESAFGFAHLDQCIVIWLILGTIAGLITLAVSLKFCNACGTCFASIISMCKDGDTGGGGGDTTIIMKDTYSSDEEDDMPPKVPQIELAKRGPRTNTLNIMGDGSDTDEEIFVDIDDQ